MALTRQSGKSTAVSDLLTAIRDVNEKAEELRADVANLHGRLDVIEALLKQSVEHRGETGSSPDSAIR